PVTRADTPSPQGLSGKKSFAGAGGMVQLLIEDSLAKITEKTYAILYAQLVPGGLQKEPIKIELKNFKFRVKDGTSALNSHDENNDKLAFYTHGWAEAT